MKQILTEEDIVGKTIQRTKTLDGVAALFFTDETFAMYKIGGWANSCIILMEDKIPLDTNSLDLVSLGFITKCQYEAHIDENKEKQKSRKEERERAQYEKLKLKFEKQGEMIDIKDIVSIEEQNEQKYKVIDSIILNYKPLFIGTFTECHEWKMAKDIQFGYKIVTIGQNR